MVDPKWLTSGVAGEWAITVRELMLTKIAVRVNYLPRMGEFVCRFGQVDLHPAKLFQRYLSASVYKS